MNTLIAVLAFALGILFCLNVNTLINVRVYKKDIKYYQRIIDGLWSSHEFLQKDVWSNSEATSKNFEILEKEIKQLKEQQNDNTSTNK